MLKTNSVFLFFSSELCYPPKKLLKMTPDWACSVWSRSGTWRRVCLCLCLCEERRRVLFWKNPTFDNCICFGTIQACEGKRRVLFIGISCGLSVSHPNWPESEFFVGQGVNLWFWALQITDASLYTLDSWLHRLHLWQVSWTSACSTLKSTLLYWLASILHIRPGACLCVHLPHYYSINNIWWKGW